MKISFPVSPEKQNYLATRMENLGIKEIGLKETFTKSSGKGGQNVNKVSTAVILFHIPSQLQIKCSIHRTQGLNRYKARDILCDKLEEKMNPLISKSNLVREKIIKKKNKKEKKYKKKLEELRIKDLDGEI